MRLVAPRLSKMRTLRSSLLIILDVGVCQIDCLQHVVSCWTTFSQPLEVFSDAFDPSLVWFSEGHTPIRTSGQCRQHYE